MATNRLETRLTARDETARAFRTLQSNLGRVETAFLNVAKVAGALGAVFAGAFVRDLVNVNKEFQSLKASLVTFTGSVESADGAFRILQDFAKQTPFSLQEVVGSFNLLVSQGIRPTESQLMSFADIAGGTSKSIMQFAEAVADASMGEFERLKEFGIKASKEGDQITLRMGDITKVVNNDSASIVQALTEIADVQFAGGAARQAATLGGAMTNLRDTIDGFMFTIGEAGFGRALAESIQELTRFIDGNDALAELISDKMTKALMLFTAGIKLVFSNADTLLTLLDVVFGAYVIKRVVATANSVIKFAKSIARAQITLAIISTVMKATRGNLLLLGGAAAAGGIAVAAFNEELQDAIESLGDKIRFTALLEAAENALGLELLSVTDAIAEFNNETGNMETQVVSNDMTLLNFIPTVEGVGGALDGSTISASDFSAALDAMKKRILPVETAITDLKDEKAALQTMVEAGVITMGDMEDALNSLAREALGLDTTLSDLASRQEIADKAFQAGIISGQEYENILSDIKSETIDYRAETEKTFGAGAIKGVKDYYQSISDNAANMGDFVGNTFTSLEGTLSDFFMTGKLDFGTFTDAIKRGLADLAAKAVITTGLNFLGDIFPSLSFADGGLVPGSGGPRADDVLARVSSGEYVIKASTVSKFGTGFFDALNGGQMPSGGGMSIDAGLMESITPGFLLGGIIKGIGNLIKGVVDAIGNVVKGIVDAIGAVIGAVSDAIKGLVEGIMSGDLMTIAGLAAGFILPGVGTAIMGNLAGGSGFISAITTGISESFAAGILGAGNLSTVAISVGKELAKDAFVNNLSDALSDKILGITGQMGRDKGTYSQDRADRFRSLYSEAGPYLAAMNGANVHAGDNVKVGERGPEMFIPGRDGTIAPIKGNASELIGAVNDMKNEIITLRRQMSRMMAAGGLAGARS
jgi:lambda family phage tail tape measure protein